MLYCERSNFIDLVVMISCKNNIIHLFKKKDTKGNLNRYLSVWFNFFSCVLAEFLSLLVTPCVWVAFINMFWSEMTTKQEVTQNKRNLQTSKLTFEIVKKNNFVLWLSLNCKWLRWKIRTFAKIWLDFQNSCKRYKWRYCLEILVFIYLL